MLRIYGICWYVVFCVRHIAFIYSSILHLQSTLNISSDYDLEFDIKFNLKKSSLLQYGLEQKIALPGL